MRYLAKLSSRLARIRFGQLSVLALSLSCATAEKKDFLGPDPNLIVPILASVQVAPKAATLQAGAEVQFSATGISTSGTSMPATVEWLADGGTITSDGRFTATESGRYRVWARIPARPQIADSSVVGVWVKPTDVLDVVVYPDSVEAGENEGVQFVAHAKLANGSTSSSVPLYWTTSAGYVDGSGWYVPTTVGEHRVIALSVNGIRGEGKVIVRKSKRTLLSLAVSPKGSTVASGALLRFDAAATWSDGSTGAPEVIWSSTGGTIDATGTYLAGGQPGTWRVVARQAKGVKADTAQVTVAAANVVGLLITPASSALAPGASQRFTASAKLSDGSTSSASVAWQATGGTMTSAGDYTAGTAGGSYLVKATLNGSTLSSQVPVSITASTATLTQLILNPSSATLSTGGSQQMAVTGLYSDGSTRTPHVSWSATGGTITSGGLYTAGSTVGTFRIIATADEGKADTSAVTISGPTLTQLVLAPSSAILQSGQTLQFSASGAWSDGSSSAPAVTYSATGGSITGAGLYTAGPSAGTYRVIATHQQSTRRDTSFVTITVHPPTLTGIKLSPSSVAVSPNGGYQFNVSGTWSDGGTDAPAVTYSATGGTVSSTGVYLAGSTPGNYRVVAKQSGGTLADTSAVTVAVSAPTLTSLVITPGSASIQKGGSRQFVAGGTWSDGTTTAPSVVWSATGGTISSAGLYIAGSSTGSFRVVAQQLNGTRADTAEVTVTAAPSLTAVVLTPESVSLSPGGTKQFTVSGTYSNGSTGVPSVTYSATGGTVTSNGLYTAGLVAGSFAVIASCSCGLADTSVVSVASATPAVPPAPGSPQFTLETAGSTTSAVRVTWAAASNATSYRYTSGLSGDGTWAGASGTTSLLTVTLAAVPNGASIWFCVYSRNNSGENLEGSCGPYTVPGSASEPPPPPPPTDTTTTPPPPQGPNGMYFNSAEPGCGTDSNILLCDDFEDGDWYTKNCDVANSSGGLLQTDGWCGTIYANALLAAGTARCGNVGVRSNCAATHGFVNGWIGGGNDGMHNLTQSVTELWIRFYTKPLTGYKFGAEKVLSINRMGNNGGIWWAGLGINVGGDPASSGDIQMLTGPGAAQAAGLESIFLRQNQGQNLSLVGGNWYYIELHIKLNTAGSSNGVFEMWINNGGANGNFSGQTPTLRTRYTNVHWGYTGSASIDQGGIGNLWWENWANAPSTGERYLDQIKVSKGGPIGFMQ